MTPLSVAFIIDETFVMPLCVALRSLLGHVAPNCDVVKVFVIEMNLPTASKDLIETSTTKCPCQVEFIPCSETSPLIAKMKLPLLLPSHLSVVIYLDADILIRADLNVLWELTKDTSCLAAVMDVGKAKPNYFNAGMMVLNLTYMREQACAEEMISKFMIAGPNFEGFPLKEQDIFNQVMGTNWQKLSFYWNAQGLGSYANFRVGENLLFTPKELQDLEENAYIVHFTGYSGCSLIQFNPHCPEPVKPWSGMIMNPSTSAPNPYVFEWFQVLYSIPEYRGWLPDRDRMKVTLQAELSDKMKAIDSQLDSWKKSLLNSVSCSISPRHGVDGEYLAVLLPITSKGADIDRQLENLQALALSLPFGKTKIFIGLDNDDIYWCNAHFRNKLEQSFTAQGFPVIIQEFPPQSPANICGITRTLARRANEDPDCFYFVLLGDDVKILTPRDQIVPHLHNAFEKIAKKTCTPFGFGCVAFHDETSVGFPTFPVITRIHLTIFEGEWCPHEFINQDADPYLFEIYRKYYSAILCRELVLRNEIGGAGVLTPITRYEKAHISWKNDLLTRGIHQIRDYFMKSASSSSDVGTVVTTLRSDVLSPSATCVTLDIIVPSYRIQWEYLERIVQLQVPANCSTTVIVIIDNPDPISHSIARNLEEKYCEKVRVRVNETNKGASYTRSRGLDESCADWILFLDDDVIPSPDLLFVFVNEIVRTGDKYAGYVGNTVMPPPETIWCKGIKLVHLLHFWSDHVTSPDHKLAPWGITAQLCLRRTDLRFNEIFPKTGGGEDIDLCLRTCEKVGLPLKNLPAAVCTHPWWNDGKVAISRFIGWAKGDSYLIDLYPQHCYRSWPNGLEMMLFMMLVWGGCWISGLCNLIIAGTFLLLSLSVIFLVDVIMELFMIMIEDASYESPLQGFERLSSGLVGVITYRFLGADWGHVVYPLLSRCSLHHFCLRYDWWCGLYPEEVKKNLIRERRRFVIMIAALVVLLLLIGHPFLSFDN